MIKLVLCGPPHSGKSCLKNGLLTALKRSPISPYPYHINACPDGEGSWFHETARVDMALAARERRKGTFSPEWVEISRAWVADTKEPLTIGDVGGRISPENRSIMAGGTHAVILSRDAELCEPWVEFCRELGLPVIAQIFSDYDGLEDRVKFNSGMLTGTIHHLDRNCDASTRPMVLALVQQILNLFNELEKS